jgi:hypothetical protein
MTRLDRRILSAVIVLVLVGLGLLWISAAHAFTCTPTSCTFTITYTEPTTNTAGGSPQLTSTTAFWTVSPGGAEKSIVTPATSLNGGGLITKLVTEAILPGQSVSVAASALATNPAGNSTRATTTPLAINRSGEVVGTPPTSLTIQ